MEGFDIHFSQKISGVYEYTHVATGRKYVGSSVNIYRRHSKHMSELRAGRHHSPQFQNAWNKHGEATFSFAMLETTSSVREEILGAEQKWIDKLCPYYNTCKIATSVLGIKRSDETRAKLSAALSGRPKTHDHIEKLRNTSTGRRHTDETKEICGIAAKKAARPRHTAERIAKFVEARSRQYILTRPDGTEISVHGLKPFCRENGLDQGNMSKVLRGDAAHHKGWKCRYADPPSCNV